MTAIVWAADTLRMAGLPVWEMDGWRVRMTRPGFTPQAIIIHHTATSTAWQDGHVAALLRDGRRDLTGPLSQHGLERDGTWVCVAAGRANHNGYGTYGNDSIGVEVYNNGTGEPYPPVQYRSLVKGVAAYLRRYAWGVDRILGHKESDPGRKIDPLFDMNQFRRDVQRELTPPPVVIPPPVVALTRSSPLVAGGADMLKFSLVWFKGEPSAAGDQPDVPRACYQVMAAEDKTTGKWYNVQANWVRDRAQLGFLRAVGMTGPAAAELGGENNPLVIGSPYDAGIVFVGGPFATR